MEDNKKIDCTATYKDYANAIDETTNDIIDVICGKTNKFSAEEYKELERMAEKCEKFIEEFKQIYPRYVNKD